MNKIILLAFLFLLPTTATFADDTKAPDAPPVDIAAIAEAMAECAAFYSIFDGKNDGFDAATGKILIEEIGKTEDEASAWMMDIFMRYHSGWEEITDEKKIAVQRAECDSLHPLRDKYTKRKH